MLKNQFGRLPSNYNKYWELIEWLQESNWFQEGDETHPAWKYRMAFVDSLVYSYTNQDYL